MINEKILGGRGKGVGRVKSLPPGGHWGCSRVNKREDDRKGDIEEDRERMGSPIA